MHEQKSCAGSNHQKTLAVWVPRADSLTKVQFKVHKDISAVLHSHIYTQLILWIWTLSCWVSMTNLDESYVSQVHQPPLGQQELYRRDIHHQGNTLARSICGLQLLARGKLKREVSREAFSFISAGISCHCYQERKQVHADGLNPIKDFSPMTTEESSTQRPSSQ